MTTNWKYTDVSNTVVVRTLDSGAVESCFISAIEDWIAAGNTPDAANPPTTEPSPLIPTTPLEARRILLGDGAIGLTDIQVDAIFHLAQTIGN